MEYIVSAVFWTEEQEGNLSELVDFLPQERRERLVRFKTDKRAEAVAAYGLLLYQISRRYSYTALPEIIHGTQGKPAFREYRDLGFNLSHTSGAALCAIGPGDVGADIEKMRLVRADHASRLQLPPEPEGFFAQWVRRESIVKYRGGSGLACRAPVPLREGEAYCGLKLAAGYAAGICLPSGASVKTEVLTFEELYSFLRNAS